MVDSYFKGLITYMSKNRPAGNSNRKGVPPGRQKRSRLASGAGRISLPHPTENPIRRGTSRCLARVISGGTSGRVLFRKKTFPPRTGFVRQQAPLMSVQVGIVSCGLSL